MAKYIFDSRFSDEKIEEIIKRCGLELKVEYSDDYNDGEGGYVPPIQRGDNVITVRCTNPQSKSEIDKILNRFPNMCFAGQFSRLACDELIFFEDYGAYRIRATEELEEIDYKIFKVHHSVMCEIFGEEYKKDCEEDWNKESQQNEDEKQA